MVSHTAMPAQKRNPSMHSPRLTLPQPGASDSLFGAAKAQLPADHAGRHQVPLVVTDGPPLSILEHLHTALPDVGPTSQAHQGLLGRHTVLLSAEGGYCWALPPGAPPSTAPTQLLSGPQEPSRAQFITTPLGMLGSETSSQNFLYLSQNFRELQEEASTCPKSAEYTQATLLPPY